MKTKYIVMLLVGISLAWSLCQPINRMFSCFISRHISGSDKLILTHFLKDLVFRHDFGYTLFGEKPIAIAGYFSQQPLGNILFLHRSSRFSFNEAWGIWEKHFKHFLSKKYLLLKEEDPNYQSLTIVTLVNKESFLAKVKEHLGLFQEILGPDVTGEKLLAQLTDNKTGLFKLIHYDEALHGILLGYGKENALAYKRRIELAAYAAPYGLYLERPFSLRYPFPSSGFTSIQKEYAFLESRLVGFNHFQKLSFVQPVVFMALLEDQETCQLKQEYDKTQKHITKIYSKGDFFDVTLKQFMDNPR